MKKYTVSVETLVLRPMGKKKHKIPDNVLMPYLQDFWKRAGKRETHLHLLREFTQIFVRKINIKQYTRWRRVRGSKVIRAWDYECFVCAAPAVLGHHVIELQRGGTNHPANIVPLCEACHQTVHPWMPAPEISEKDRPFWA